MKDACSEGFGSGFFRKVFARSEAFISYNLLTDNRKHEKLFYEGVM